MPRASDESRGASRKSLGTPARFDQFLTVWVFRFRV